MRTSFLVVALLGSAGCQRQFTILPPEPDIAEPDVNPEDVTECAFSRVEASAFYRYDCNPVFPERNAQGGPKGDPWAADIGAVAFHVTQVFGHPVYQAWYTGTTANGYGGIGYAVSDDGTNWDVWPDNPVLEASTGRAWDSDSMDALQVVWDPRTSTYVMLYQGIQFNDVTPWGLGVATSTDGRDWVRSDNNPVVPFDGLDPTFYWCWPLGIDLAGDGGLSGIMGGGLVERVTSLSQNKCVAYSIGSESLDVWATDPKLFFSTGEEGAWDDMGISSLAVAELGGVRYLFYTAFSRWTCVPSGRNSDQVDQCPLGTEYQAADRAFFGYAVEEDGRWVRKGKVPLNLTAAGEVSSVAAQTVDSRIHLWLTDNYDGGSAIGYFLFDPDRAALEDGGTP